MLWWRMTDADDFKASRKLDRANKRLNPKDVNISMAQSGKYGIAKINRGAHPQGYDTYTEVRKAGVHDTVEAAEAAAKKHFAFR